MELSLGILWQSQLFRDVIVQRNDNNYAIETATKKQQQQQN